ncbi:CHAT domain-containing protein [Mycena maculata]|uniref:CHAT domain-containing protein n=1 Tax=Mycena maculata TaxID=230809 RepID=A0AAD7J556_9AGAR|nr:CHAT domain-containing protein [Mycena maculata]
MQGGLFLNNQRHDDVEARVKAAREALDLASEGHPDRADCLYNSARCLKIRYEMQGHLDDLRDSLLQFREAVGLAPKGHHKRAELLQGLAETQINEYQRFGDIKDLESALHAAEEALDLTPAGHAGHAPRLKILAMSYENRYERFGDLNDLEAAMRVSQEAVILTPRDHPDRVGCLHIHAVSLRKRFQRMDDLQALATSLQKMQEVLSLMPEDHPQRAASLNNLATCFSNRFERLGDLADLEASIKIAREAVCRTPKGHLNRAEHLQTLSVALNHQYKKLGDITDLEASIENCEEAVDLTPDGHPKRSSNLRCLSVARNNRYTWMGDLKDLEAVLQITQEAVDLTPEDHPDKANCLQDLASSMNTRYCRLGFLKDLENSLQTMKHAVDRTPRKHPNRADRLHKLGLSFIERYQRLRDLKDLETAIRTHQEAVNLTPHGHPDRVLRLQSLSSALLRRYKLSRKSKDLRDVHYHYRSSFKLSSPTPEISWYEALQWASFAAESHSPHCITAYVTAFGLLPEILWIGNSITVRQNAIYRLGIAQATSAAIRTCLNLSILTSGVEIMEQGLATIFQQMLQLKTEPTGLKPDQAKLLQDLSSQLYSGTSPNPLKLVNDRNNLLEDIRKDSGLKYFLLPKPYNDLRYASQGGPVIILNSHPDHCDGIIIPGPTSDPVELSLQNVTLARLNTQQTMLKDLLSRCNVRMRGESLSSRLFGQQEDFSAKPISECFENILAWLWIYVVAPVYQVLKSHGISNGRVWWLPTGAFTGLPLHASPPTDEFIHSYTPTLGSLLDAYAKKFSATAHKISVVGVTHTGPNGNNWLPGVEREVQKIMSIPQAQCVCLQGEQATVNAVKVQLQDCSWAHLACHGRQDPVDPTKSHLQLYGGTLSLETILRMPFQNAQVVFLAACQTAMGDAQLVNESLHLGGGFIAAGFRGAIGTMWSMNDEDGPTVAEIVYSHLFRTGQEPQAADAAEALHLAVKILKERKVPYERWMPFIHMGI